MKSAIAANPKRFALLGLLAATAVWGWTFVLVKHAVAHTSVGSFLTWRFVIATVILIALRPKGLLTLSRRDLYRCLWMGLSLLGGYFFQSLGLRDTSAAVSGFLTGLQVIFVPLLAWVIFRRHLSHRIIVATGVSLVGVGVLTLHGFSISAGDLLTVACAASFAVQVAVLETEESKADPLALAAVQLGIVAIGSLLSTLPNGPGIPHGSALWSETLICALGATAFAFAIQTWAQQHLTAAYAAVVLSFEPVFAALFAWMMGATLRWTIFVGGPIVLCAMFIMGFPSAKETENHPLTNDRDSARREKPLVVLSEQALSSTL
jgi:drug/metabolite transporter (DMT)-like permease